MFRKMSYIILLAGIIDGLCFIPVLAQFGQDIGGAGGSGAVLHSGTPGKQSSQAFGINSQLLAQQQEDVHRVQTLLGQLGYDVGSADGILGRRSRKAIVRFQRDHGLAPTGTVDVELLDALQRAVSRPLSTQPSAASGRESAEPEGAAGVLLAESTEGERRERGLSCDSQPPMEARATPKVIDASPTSGIEQLDIYSAKPDLIVVNDNPKITGHEAGGGDDTIYVNAVRAGTAVGGGSGGDNIVVCGLGGLSLLLMAGPVDVATDVFVIDTAAFENKPGGNPTIVIGDFVSTNDQLYIRAPAGAKIAYGNMQITVNGVRIQLLGDVIWKPDSSGKAGFNTRSVFVSTDPAHENWTHPPKIFGQRAGFTLFGPLKAFSHDIQAPITLSGRKPETIHAGMACGKAARSEKVAKPVELSTQESFGDTGVRYGDQDNMIVFKGTDSSQGVVSGGGDDQIFLYNLPSGASVASGGGADLVKICDVQKGMVSLNLKIGEEGPSADVDADRVVIDSSVFKDVPPGFARVIRIFQFHSANDQLIMSVPAGRKIRYADTHIGSSIVRVGDVVVEIYWPADVSGKKFDWNSVILVPEDVSVDSVDDKPPTQASLPGNWQWGAARDLSGNAAGIAAPPLKCSDLDSAETAHKWAQPVNQPDNNWETVLRAYSRADDWIRLEGNRRGFWIHAGQGDDTIYLADIGDGVRIDGNSGSDLIVLCSMHGAAVHINPGSGMLDAQPDRVIIAPDVFLNVPKGIERKIYVDGFNPVNDRLLVVVPEGLKVNTRSEGTLMQEIRVGAVTIHAGAGTLFNDISFDLNSVDIVPARQM